MRDALARKGARLLAGAAVLALCGAAAAAGSAAVRLTASQADNATMTVTYITPNTLQIKLADGTVVRSGSVVPAGSYQVLVYDDSEQVNPKFAITGPGVSVTSDLNSTGMGIDSPAYLGPFTFQTSSSYRIEDTGVGASSAITFSTSASATASGGSSSGGSSGSGGSVSSAGSGSSSGSPSGSSATKTLATLRAAVNASGTATLTLGGKAVKTLKSGAYKITISDQSKKVGLIVATASGHKIILSGGSAVGTGTKTVTLGVGKWFFEVAASGPKTAFSVTK